jgi:arylsulfatase A-like enzyme
MKYAILLALVCSQLHAAMQPNIIAILVDDVGVGDFGFTGGKDFPTPHIDQLAREGCVFTNGYANPMCSPTRAAMLTGRYTQRFGIEDNRPLDGELTGMDVNETTLPQKLRESGYHTRLIGKWHLGKGARHEFAPRNRGFDEFFGYFGAAGKYVEPTLSRNGREKAHSGYLTDILTDEACAFLRQRHEKPFFLHLAHMAAHYPQEAQAQDLERVPHLKGKRRTCAAILTNLDDNIGKLMAALKSSGQDDNTLVFFISDNGGEPPVLATTNGPHRGGKFSVLEGGIRVPFVMRWPGKIRAGSTFEPMVHVMDVFATSLAAAGGQSTVPLDGVDLMPHLAGQIKTPPHDQLCWLVGDIKEWRTPDRDTNLARKLSAIRSGDTKLVLHGDEAPQLYDLSTDPGEANDLAITNPQRVTELKDKLDAWRSQMQPQIIPDNHPLYGSQRKRTGKKPPFVGSVPAGGPVPQMEVPEQKKHPMPDRDKFGGFTGIQIQATGNFRVEQVKGRWFFITPEGHPFIALGPNHTGPTIRDQGRNNGLWQRWHGSADETAKAMLPIIQDLGFTAGDVYQPESTYTRTLPWITFFWYGDTNHTFIDVFDDGTMADVTRRAYEHAKSVADNPWILGIGGPDLSIWDAKLVRQYRSLKPDAKGRLKYATFLMDRYQRDITAFNQAYGTQFTSFDDLAAAEKLVYPTDLEDDKLDPTTLRWRLPKPPTTRMEADNDAFCALIASTLFPQVRAAVKRGAPNHLFLGEHLAVRMIPDAVIAAMAPHIDAYLAQAVEVSPQRPPEWQVFQSDRWDAEYALLKKPIIIVDWGAVFSLGEPFEHKGYTIKTEREASDEAAKFVRDAFDRPYIIGLFLCKLWGNHKNDKNFFQDRATRTYLKPDATPYPYRTEALKRANLGAQTSTYTRLLQ